MLIELIIIAVMLGGCYAIAKRRGEKFFYDKNHL